MQMSHFSIDLQHSLNRFHKSAMDPPRFPSHHDAADCEDRLSAVNETPERSQPLISEGHVAPVPPYDKETMFEKPLTPSDVGKLNRLVIPKQYAEKYFPLAGGGGADAAGTLLGFEDEAGKCWRFRYSYWNSSQSYVLTKGWSRYVKEKRLDAGDVVVFERHRAEPERLLIGWRRRGAVPPQPTTAFCYNAQGYGIAQDSRRGAGAHPYQDDRRRVAGGAKQEEETVGNGNNNPRRLVRLFGVNLECQLSNAQSSSPSGTTSSQASNSHNQQQQQPIQTQQHPQEEAYRNYFNYMGLSPNHHHHHHHMEMEFTQTQGGVNRLG